MCHVCPVNRDRLAVQVPDRITIYELSTDDAFDMRYRVRRKISKKLDCNLLVVTSLHVILCLVRGRSRVQRLRSAM